MSMFSSKSSGGLLDVIRCDESEYLIWKWSPSGAPDRRQNAIRYGSSLRVKEGELAVFVYQQADGSMLDMIRGPHDGIIKSANFPVLASIVGSAFGGQAPFQAEIYFVNLQGNNQVRIAVPFFEVYDFRFQDLGVPVAIHGKITFNLTDHREFFRLNRLIDFSLPQLQRQIQDAVTRIVKSEVTNASETYQIPVLQMERRLNDICASVEPRIANVLGNDFGVNLKRLDLSTIEFDMESEAFHMLRRATAEQQVKASDRMADINLTNSEEALRIARKNVELGVETSNLAAHQINQQTEALKAAAVGMAAGGLGGDGAMNPAGMMAGIALGGAVGSQMANMVNRAPIQPMPSPPPAPAVLYYIAINGQQAGPYSLDKLRQMELLQQFTRSHHIWREGMGGWALAADVPEVAGIFAAAPPPPPMP